MKFGYDVSTRSSELFLISEKYMTSLKEANDFGVKIQTKALDNYMRLFIEKNWSGSSEAESSMDSGGFIVTTAES